MTKMQCLRDHSSVVWGTVSAGDVFEVAEGYVAQLEAEGLAKLIEEAPVTQDVPEYHRKRHPKL
jgi:hypothetical protein